MLRLVKNEYIKLLRKGGFIALSLIFLVSTLLLPIAGYLLDKNSDVINNKLNGFVNNTLIESEKQGGNTEYVNLLEFFKEEEIGIYDNSDWRAFAGQVAFSSTRVVNTDIIDENEDDTDPIFYGRFSVASLNSELDSAALCKEVKKEISDNDLIAFKKTFNDKIYPAYKSLLTKYGNLIFSSTYENFYCMYHHAFDVLDKYNIEPNADDWTYDVALDYGKVYSVVDEIKANSTGDLSEDELKNQVHQYDNDNNADIDEYRLEKGISESIQGTPIGGYSSESDFFMTFIDYNMLITFAGLILFMVGIGIISKEYNQGTIKFLLVNPVKRSSIFWSKVITIVSMLTIATLWLMLSQFILNTIFYGPYPKGIAYIFMKNGKIMHESGTLLIAKAYLNSFVGALMLCLTAIFLSALIRNGAFATGITLFVYLAGQIGGGILAARGFNIFQFALFQNTDLLAISKGRTTYRMQNFKFSLMVLIVHAIIFLWSARDSFVKKDI